MLYAVMRGGSVAWKNRAAILVCLCRYPKGLDLGQRSVVPLNLVAFESIDWIYIIALHRRPRPILSIDHSTDQFHVKPSLAGHLLQKVHTR